MHKVIFSLLEHGADEKGLDKGKAFGAYKEKHPFFDDVRRFRLISTHKATQVVDGQKVRVG